MSDDGLPTPDRLAAGDWPGVSAVMPVLNEERHLATAVAAVLSQEYPGELELVLALGPSHDGTDLVAAGLADRDRRIRIVVNPAGSTPAALNVAIAATANPVVVRVDGHASLSPRYIRRAVELLVTTGADNVGGVMDAEGSTPFERAVARAMTSRWGIGNAVFHIGGTDGPADSVYLGVFRRAALQRIGGFDDHYRRAQDWELNLRLRRSGGIVWFSPDLRVAYRPRSTWRALAAQFSGSGRWRREILHRHAGTNRLRYLAPPLVTVAVLSGAALGAVGTAGLLTARRLPAGWPQRLVGGPLAGAGRALVLGWAAPVVYGAGVVVAGRRESAGLPTGTRLRLPAVFAVMHLAWGVGFLRGVPDPQAPPGRRRRALSRLARRAADQGVGRLRAAGGLRTDLGRSQNRPAPRS